MRCVKGTTKEIGILSEIVGIVKKLTGPTANHACRCWTMSYLWTGEMPLMESPATPGKLNGCLRASRHRPTRRCRQPKVLTAALPARQSSDPMPFMASNSRARSGPLGPGVLTVTGSARRGTLAHCRGRGLSIPSTQMLSVQPGGHALLIRGTATSTVQVNGVELAGPRTLLSIGDNLIIGTAELRYSRLAPGAG